MEKVSEFFENLDFENLRTGVGKWVDEDEETRSVMIIASDKDKVLATATGMDGTLSSALVTALVNADDFGFGSVVRATLKAYWDLKVSKK